MSLVIFTRASVLDETDPDITRIVGGTDLTLYEHDDHVQGTLEYYFSLTIPRYIILVAPHYENEDRYKKINKFLQTFSAKNNVPLYIIINMGHLGSEKSLYFGTYPIFYYPPFGKANSKSYDELVKALIAISDRHRAARKAVELRNSAHISFASPL